MAIPPCQGPFGEGAGSKLYFASFWAGADLEDRLRSFKPLRQCNDSSGSIEEYRVAVDEVLIGTLPCTR